MTLTPRQLEVATLVSEGHTNNDIALLLGVSEETVKSHLKVMFQRLGCKNRVELAVIYLQSLRTPE